MRTIHKYLLHVAQNQIINMPKNAQLLSTKIQHEGVQLWVLLDTNEPLTPRMFDVVGTGFELDDNPGKHVGTVITENGQYVWHVFDHGYTQ